MLHVGTYSASLSQGGGGVLTEQEHWEGNLVETMHFQISLLPLSSDVALLLQEKGLRIFQLVIDFIHFTSFYVPAW